MPVYSIQMASVSGLGSGLHTLYTVPSGKVAVVRDIDLVMDTTGAAVAHFLNGSTGVEFWPAVVNVPGDYRAWRGRQVFTAGQTLKVSISAQQMDITISGYLLSA